MRTLASIQVITSLNPIPGADAIERARILGWDVVVKKGDFSVGDKVIYCEIDSLLPVREEFEFLRKSCYRAAITSGEGQVILRDGFRIKTVRLRGQVSQGICFPVSMFFSTSPAVGTDVTDHISIIKYDPPVPAALAGKVKGNFPSFLPKTDEVRVQNIVDDLAQHAGQRLYMTEKLDGSSATVFKHDGTLGLCSRNLWLDERDENLTLGKVARELDLSNVLPDGYAIQGELIGPGIQGNLYALNRHQLRIFTVLCIRDGYSERLSIGDARRFVADIGLTMVPYLGEIDLDHSVDDIVEMSRGKSMLNSNVHREGIVFRPLNGGEFSFKAINPDFLLKHEL